MSMNICSGYLRITDFWHFSQTSALSRYRLVYLCVCVCTKKRLRDKIWKLLNFSGQKMSFWCLPYFFVAKMTSIWLRPCERQNFPNFSYSHVSELFGFRSSEFFLEKPGISEFIKKSSEISLGQTPLLLGQKTLFLRQKQGFWGQKQGFPNIPNLRIIQNLFYSKFSKNYVKIEFLFLRKTHSDLNSNLNIQFQVRNAGP